MSLDKGAVQKSTAGSNQLDKGAVQKADTGGGGTTNYPLFASENSWGRGSGQLGVYES